MQLDLFTTLISIVHESGWVCQECLSSQYNNVNKLKAELAATNETVADMKTVLLRLSKDFDAFRKASHTVVDNLPDPS